MYTIGSRWRARSKQSCVSTAAQLYAGSDGFSGLKPEGREAGATVSQNNGTLIALAPAAVARASPSAASGPVKTYGSTRAVLSGRVDAAVALDATIAASVRASAAASRPASRRPGAARSTGAQCPRPTSPITIRSYAAAAARRDR